MKGLTIIVILAATLALNGCGFNSDADKKMYFGEQRQPEALEFQFLYLARYLDSAKPCYLIHQQSLTKAPFNPSGSRVSFLRSTCFRDVAFHTGDESLCQQVHSVSTLLLSGANLNKSNCLETATGTGRVSNSLNIPEILSLAGYSESDVEAFLVAQGRYSTTVEAAYTRQQNPAHYWSAVRHTLLHSRDFFDRIDQFQGFADSRDQIDMAAVPWQPRNPGHSD